MSFEKRLADCESALPESRRTLESVGKAERMTNRIIVAGVGLVVASLLIFLLGASFVGLPEERSDHSDKGVLLSTPPTPIQSAPERMPANE